MKTTIQFFGVAGYKIVTEHDVSIVIDPFMDGNPYCPVKSEDLGKVDILVLTHNAFDHFGDAPKIIKDYKPVTICALDVQFNLTKYHGVDPDLIRPTIWGMEMREKGVAVRPVESRHWSFAKAPDGQLLSGPAMGFVIDIGGGEKYYHPGDTALFYDMKVIRDICGPTSGFVHVSLPMEEGVGLPHPESYGCGELTPKEALTASEWLGLKEVIASHYVDADCDDVKEFLRLVEENKEQGKYVPHVIVLKPGEIYKKN